jgi:hypothetical protein
LKEELVPFTSKEVLVNIEHRFRTGSVAACFSWPSNTTTIGTATTSAFGEDVLVSQRQSNWKTLVSRGISATTRFVAEQRLFTYTPGYFSFRMLCKPTNNYAYHEEEGNLSQSLSTILDLPSSPSSTISQSALAQAIQGAWRDARQKQGAFKGSTFMAELRDTIRGIRNPARGMRRGIDDYHKAARRNARRANNGRSLPRSSDEFRRLGGPRRDAISRALSDTWLEHAFGWVPLANDIGDAVIAGVRLSRRQPRVRFHGYGEEELNPNVLETNVSFGSSPWSMRWTTSLLQHHSVRIYGAVRLELDSPGASAFEEYGFTPKDFAPALWEAIPYSFLVDYFSNVGDVVNALSFPKTDIAWCARTFVNASIRDSTRARIVQTGSTTETLSTRWELLERTPSTVHWSRRLVDRIEYNDLPLPQLRFEIPGSKDWKKWLNIGALAKLRGVF